MSARMALVFFGAWAAALTTANFAFGSLHAILWTAIGVSSVAAVLFGIWRNKPRHRLPWFLLAGALACLVAGDLTADLLIAFLDQENPFPSVADAIYAVMYPLIAAGMVILYRRGVVRRDVSVLIDALTLTAGVGLVSWIFLIDPYLHDPTLTGPQKAFAIAYPLGDILVLAAGARLVASARLTPALAMLALGGVGLLSADVAFGLNQLSGDWRLGTPVDLGWVAFYALWGAAAVHPSMRELTEPKVLAWREERLSRLVLLGLSALIAPAMLILEVVRGEVRNGLGIAVMSAVLTALVLVRLARALQVHRHAVEREGALRRAGADMLLAADRAGVVRVVKDAVTRLLPRGCAYRVVLLTGDDDAPNARLITGMAMRYTRSLDARLARQLGGFEVTLCCPLNTEKRTGGGRLGTLYVAAAEAALVALQEAAQVLAAQAALALERIALSDEIDRRNREAYFRTLVLSTADVILIVDDHNRIQFASPSATTLFGTTHLIGADLAELVEPDSAVDVCRRLDAVRNGCADYHDRDWAVRCGGHRRALVEVSCRDLRHEPTVNGVVVTMRDVTDRRRLEDELYQRATFDNLTGLPNRDVFLMVAQEAIRGARHDDRPLGVIVVELDDFKMINNTLGHEAGDELLVAVGQRLADTMRASDPHAARPGVRVSPSVARMGGDEFAVMVRNADVEQVADEIMKTFQQPFVLSHGVVTASASAGIATATDTSEAQELLRQADLAAYVAKDAGKGRWLRYEASLHTAVVDRLKLRSDLEKAIATNELLLHFQPIQALENATTVGFEALVRWDHPTRGLLPPRQFIDLAENSGLIVPMGAWVVHHAVEAAARWQQLRPEDYPYVSVNVSPRQFRAPGFVDQLRRELVAFNLPYQALIVEITEGLLMAEDGDIAKELNRLRDEGVRIAIDDFGTGFSSLSYLRQLPVDMIKLDRSFVDSITSSQEQLAVVDTIIRLADKLHLDVVAEGIEKPEELELLKKMGCRYGQGYLIAPPMSYGDAVHWLRESESRSWDKGGSLR